MRETWARGTFLLSVGFITMEEDSLRVKFLSPLKTHLAASERMDSLPNADK